jgi:hypothetical protein
LKRQAGKTEYSELLIASVLFEGKGINLNQIGCDREKNNGFQRHRCKGIADILITSVKFQCNISWLGMFCYNQSVCRMNVRGNGRSTRKLNPSRKEK